jgi:hypothetical protein
MLGGVWASWRAVPLGLRSSVAFFLATGVLEVLIPFLTEPDARRFVKLWEATGRALLAFLVAAGLLRRLALARSIAMAYCLCVPIVYLAALSFALAGAPLRYPPSLILGGLFQVPACAALYPWLRSRAAAVLFTRALLGG